MLTAKIEQRIAQYIGFLERGRYKSLGALEFETFQTDKTYRAPPEDAEWKPIPTPYEYGEAWTCSWFRASFSAPSDASGGLFIKATPNADSLAFLDGKPVGAFNPFHGKLRMPADGARHSLCLESYAGHPFPGEHPFSGESVILTLSRRIPKYPNLFEGGELLERREAVYSLYYDALALFDLAKSLPPDSLRKARVLKGLYDALMGISFASEGEKLETEAAAAALRLAPLLAARNGDTSPEIFLVGHAHIDHAWLWPIAETERKVARTYANMARLSEEYPEFKFIQSQPCQLEIVEREYPEVFTAVKAAYERGSWEPNGGMWVEADCNVTGGESLVRQFLVGKAATRRMLGHETDTLWLPDVFGYSGALPQILALCGIDFFVTSKINWNDTTHFPYDSFVWRGIDGTGVKTHFITSRAEGYNGRVSVEGLNEIWREVQHKELQPGCLKSIGEGDGGGGTTRADLEQARRLGNLEGAPRSSWTKVSDALAKIFGEAQELPEWRGELYLELHRGTYTSQARTKRYNRKLEFTLRRVELLATLAALEAGAPYPREALLAAWKILLTNQFHDIIPGSSIGRVYEDAERDYRRLESTLAGLQAKAIESVAPRSAGELAVFNSLSWERGDLATLPAQELGEAAALVAAGSSGAAGSELCIQRYEDLDSVELAAFAPRLPALGWASFELADTKGAKRPSPFAYSGSGLETPLYSLSFDEAGRIASMRMKSRGEGAQAELVAQGGVFNGFVSAEDLPILWEAWDIDSDWSLKSRDETRLESTEIVSDGPLFFRLRRRYRIGEASSLVQDMVLYAEDGRVDFETKVEWRERRRLLKVAFDTAIDATEARCEIQYGHALRNTHRNLPSDRAKFEVCAHKWVCLEEASGGIALLNDCKYGHDFSGGSMRLTLLRSPTAPDPEADQGEQRFTYSILPFDGPFAASRVVSSGYELNERPLAVAAPNGGERFLARREPAGSGFCSVSAPGVIVEAVKLAEEEDPTRDGGDRHRSRVVLRLYESLGGRTKTKLSFGRAIATAQATDMLERSGKPLAFSGQELELEFRAFEIKTLVLEFEGC